MIVLNILNLRYILKQHFQRFLLVVLFIGSSSIYSVNNKINLDIGCLIVLPINKKEITFKMYVAEFLFFATNIP